jgi:hypothetical protein
MYFLLPPSPITLPSPAYHHLGLSSQNWHLFGTKAVCNFMLSNEMVLHLSCHKRQHPRYSTHPANRTRSVCLSSVLLDLHQFISLDTPNGSVDLLVSFLQSPALPFPSFPSRSGSPRSWASLTNSSISIATLSKKSSRAIGPSATPSHRDLPSPHVLADIIELEQRSGARSPWSMGR